MDFGKREGKHDCVESYGGCVADGSPLDDRLGLAVRTEGRSGPLDSLILGSDRDLCSGKKSDGYRMVKKSATDPACHHDTVHERYDSPDDVVPVPHDEHPEAEDSTGRCYRQDSTDRASDHCCLTMLTLHRSEE